MNKIRKNEIRIMNKKQIDKEFILACQNNDLEVVSYLLTSPEIKIHADIHSNEDLGLKFAAEKGHFEIIKYLLTSSDLKTYADIHSGNDEILMAAAQSGIIELVQFLLESPDLKEKLNPRGYRTNADVPLHRAVWENKVEVVQYLLNRVEYKSAKDINQIENEILNVAYKNNCIKMINFLIFEQDILNTNEYSETTLKNPELIHLLNKRELEKKLTHNLKVSNSENNKKSKI